MKEDHLNSTDFNLWHTIREETEATAAAESMLVSFLYQIILRHQSLDSVLTYYLSGKLNSLVMDVRALFGIYQQALSTNTRISKHVEADLKAIYERNLACDGYSLPLLHLKGFHAIQAHRINHWLYQNGHKTLAYFLQDRMSEAFGTNIHPVMRFGHGLMLDHATGFVAGEAAALGNSIPIFHGVTLGNSGKESGGRRPKIGDDVIIDVNVPTLGNIHIGKNTKIGAGSVVVVDVPSLITVVDAPARPVGRPSKVLSANVDQSIQSSSTDFVI